MLKPKLNKLGGITIPWWQICLGEKINDEYIYMININLLLLYYYIIILLYYYIIIIVIIIIIIIII